MKTFHFTLTAMLLLGLTTAAVAQERIITAEEANIINITTRQIELNIRKQIMLESILGGNGLILTAWGLEADVRTGMGISEEQNRKIREKMRMIDEYHFSPDTQDDPDFQALREELRKSRRAVYDVVASNPADMNAIMEAQERYGVVKRQLQDMVDEKRVNFINETLTFDQMKKVQEFHISTMSETGSLSPLMFEALDLSDTQKKQLGEIKKKMEPLFAQLVGRTAELDEKRRIKLNDGLSEKLDALPNQEEKQKLLDDIQRKIRIELQPEWDKILESGKELANELKIEMFDVLTDEQWNRMVDLIDNPPDYVVAYLKRLKERRAENKKPEVWTPGPNSWKPGDAIPEGYRQQRSEGRFPRNVQSE